MRNDLKTWLLKVADGVEEWPSILRDARDAVVTIATPTAAAGFIIGCQVPLDQRAAIARAVPLLPSDDFVAAARLIREAALRGGDSRRP